MRLYLNTKSVLLVSCFPSTSSFVRTHKIWKNTANSWSKIRLMSSFTILNQANLIGTIKLKHYSFSMKRIFTEERWIQLENFDAMLVCRCLMNSSDIWDSRGSVRELELHNEWTLALGGFVHRFDYLPMRKTQNRYSLNQSYVKLINNP